MYNTLCVITTLKVITDYTVEGGFYYTYNILPSAYAPVYPR